MATSGVAINFHKNGPRLSRAVIEGIFAVVTFFLLIQGDFFV